MTVIVVMAGLIMGQALFELSVYMTNKRKERNGESNRTYIVGGVGLGGLGVLAVMFVVVAALVFAIGDIGMVEVINGVVSIGIASTVIAVLKRFLIENIVEFEGNEVLFKSGKRVKHRVNLEEVKGVIVGVTGIYFEMNDGMVKVVPSYYRKNYEVNSRLAVIGSEVNEDRS